MTHLEHVHGGQPFSKRGPSPTAARRVVIALHGRGAGAEDILGLAGELDLADTAWLAPQAAGATWYPYSFLAPLAANQPALDSALRRVGELVAELESGGVDAGRIALLGFSQGACLALESAARLGRRLGGVVAFSGGRIGPPDLGWAPAAPALAGMPVFLGCSDHDPHVPAGRVRETVEFFRGAGAAVDARLYPGLGHTINDDEIAAARLLIERI